jgi:phosphotransacetylase
VRHADGTRRAGLDLGQAFGRALRYIKAMVLRILGIALLWALLLASAAGETIYKYRQADGQVIYSSRPITGAILDGPLGFDNAVSVTAARSSHLKSAVAGQADILIAPDLEAGNMLAKQLEHLADAVSGGVVVGARIPIVLANRNDTIESRVASLVLALLVANHQRAPR